MILPCRTKIVITPDPLDRFGEIKTNQLLRRYTIRIWEKLSSKVVWFCVDIFFWNTLYKTIGLLGSFFCV